jgi:hypothetical protein
MIRLLIDNHLLIVVAWGLVILENNRIDQTLLILIIWKVWGTDQTLIFLIIWKV